MERIIHLLCAFGLWHATAAQELVYSENFDTGVLDDSWIWQGGYPYLGPPAFSGAYALLRESQDQSNPPVTNEAGALAFRPLPYVPGALYQLNVAMFVSDPTGSGCYANCALGWFDPATGLFSYPIFHTSDIQQWVMYWGAFEPMPPNPYGPGTLFGLAMVTNPSATNALTMYDDVEVNMFLPTGVADGGPASRASLYPVPAQDRLQVEFPVTGAVQWSIHDGHGRLLRTGRWAEAAAMALDLGGLPWGLYALRWSGEQASGTDRFIKH
ncbi:MAG: hypothetical protein R2817_07870 [Flavobacteriales bacterium]